MSRRSVTEGLRRTVNLRAGVGLSVNVTDPGQGHASLVTCPLSTADHQAVRLIPPGASSMKHALPASSSTANAMLLLRRSVHIRWAYIFSRLISVVSLAVMSTRRISWQLMQSSSSIVSDSCIRSGCDLIHLRVNANKPEQITESIVNCLL